MTPRVAHAARSAMEGVMKSRIVQSSPRQRVLGTIGLVAIALLGWACDQDTVPARRAGVTRRLLARVIVKGVTAVGWAFDLGYRPAPHVPPGREPPRMTAVMK